MLYYVEVEAEDPGVANESFISDSNILLQSIKIVVSLLANDTYYIKC